jgi:hypothetical protein
VSETVGKSFKGLPPRGGTTLWFDGDLQQLENPASRL